MALRISTSSTFARVLLGIRSNQRDSIRAQEQIASGRRILRPSDDPAGATRAISLNRQLADVGRFGTAINASRTYTDTAGAALENASGLVTEARATLLRAMNGTLNSEDRRALATQLELIRSQLIEIGNQRSGDRFLFSGTRTSEEAFSEENVSGLARVVYRGDEEEQLIRVGEGVNLSVNVPGSEIFGRIENSGLRFGGLTGVSNGLTADEGQGYEYLTLRHDSTDPGNLASVGVSLANGGANDTLLNTQSIRIDAANGTVRLGNGATQALPVPGTPEYANFAVRNEQGAELYLDFTGFTGASYAGTVTGNGSISLDGSSFQPLTFSETDLELRNAATGSTIHVNTAGVLRAGKELVQFGGTVNVFDTLQGAIEDLRSAADLDNGTLLSRLNLRLEELDRNQSNIQVGLGVLGSRSQRLGSASERVSGLEVQLRSLLSNVVDADYADVALQLTQSDLALQAAQASGARLIQSSLLNFI